MWTKRKKIAFILSTLGKDETQCTPYDANIMTHFVKLNEVEHLKRTPESSMPESKHYKNKSF